MKKLNLNHIKVVKLLLLLIIVSAEITAIPFYTLKTLKENKRSSTNATYVEGNGSTKVSNVSKKKILNKYDVYSSSEIAYYGSSWNESILFKKLVSSDKIVIMPLGFAIALTTSDSLRYQLRSTKYIPFINPYGWYMGSKLSYRSVMLQSGTPPSSIPWYPIVHCLYFDPTFIAHNTDDITCHRLLKWYYTGTGLSCKYYDTSAITASNLKWATSYYNNDPVSYGGTLLLDLSIASCIQPQGFVAYTHGIDIIVRRTSVTNVLQIVQYLNNRTITAGTVKDATFHPDANVTFSHAVYANSDYAMGQYFQKDTLYQE